MATPNATSTPPDAVIDPAASLKQALVLLKTRNDTSRFVGLALLRSLLDNHDELRNDPETISECWAALSPKFLDRLLRSSESPGKISQTEARAMVDLAVAVIHSFTVLMADSASYDKVLIGRTDALMAALVSRWVQLFPLGCSILGFRQIRGILEKV